MADVPPVQNGAEIMYFSETPPTKWKHAFDALRPGYGCLQEVSNTPENTAWKVNTSPSPLIAGERNMDLLALLQQAIAFSANAVVITDCHGVILYVNPAFTEITGYTADEAIGNTPRMLKSGQHSDAFYRELWQTVLRGEVWRGEMTNRKKNGELYWEYMTIAPMQNEAGEITHFVAIKEDITRRKRAELELERQATTDALTGIPNRRYFFQHGEMMFTATHEHQNGMLSGLMIDIDHFKSINDRYGHATGDIVLQEVASRLKHHLRPGDLLARYGGEEFAVLLPRTAQAGSLTIAERLRTAIAERPVATPAGAIMLTVSIGVAQADKDTASLENLLSCADSALYQAKNAGRNQVVVWGHTSDAAAGNQHTRKKRNLRSKISQKMHRQQRVFATRPKYFTR